MLTLEFYIAISVDVHITVHQIHRRINCNDLKELLVRYNGPRRGTKDG